MVTDEIRRVRGAERTHVGYENRDFVVDALLKARCERNAFPLSVSTVVYNSVRYASSWEDGASVRHISDIGERQSAIWFDIR